MAAGAPLGSTLTIVLPDGPCEIGEMAPRGEMTEHELGDSSEVVARRVAGYLDLVASVALPLAYLLFILIYLLQYEAASMIRRSNFRNALSTPRAGSTRRTRTTSRGRSSSTSRRSASRRRSAASGEGLPRDKLV